MFPLPDEPKKNAAILLTRGVKTKLKTVLYRSYKELAKKPISRLSCLII
jgi:hypothetical protein